MEQSLGGGSAAANDSPPVKCDALTEFEETEDDDADDAEGLQVILGRIPEAGPPEEIEKVNEIIRVVDDALDESSLNFLLEENTTISGYEKRKGRVKRSIRFGYESDGED